ncbi:MAG: acetyl-CoA carboxylase, carboxyltransferase subunit beta [Oscillospiraceae bacterium]|nr:acetyl-CoA carboxylase, carboxyltransferase subunit beta [Oscillospiraceae bacterium]MDD4368524.1 acetyl-CoA carboxylase, carboxyltransferase subunit beta [Oscillospiraceae bacterium]
MPEQDKQQASLQPASAGTSRPGGAARNSLDLANTLRRRVNQESHLQTAAQAYAAAHPEVKPDGSSHAADSLPQPRPFSYQQPQPADLWVKCPACKGVMYREDFLTHHSVCLHCGHHFRISARERLDMVLDPDSFEACDASLESVNPLNFKGYEDKLKLLQSQTGLQEAVVTGRGLIDGRPCCIGALDSRFMMGSMGSAVGEKITRLFERAVEQRLPVLLFTVSGGARMQEGLLSLMQMAKTSAAVARHQAEGLLYIAFLTDPTTGGVTASFASLGNYLISEPGTIIGFAGRRVIEGTIAEALPEDFQRAEFQLAHGFLDLLVRRSESRQLLSRLLAYHSQDTLYPSCSLQQKPAPAPPGLPQTPDLREHRGSECLDLIHLKDRPNFNDYLQLIFTDIIELHGDRCYGDDPALWGGLARLDGRAVTLLGTVKGHNLAENNRCHFGMPHPEGYRKARRLMQEACRCGRPVVCLIDTPGAYCGVGAEERGQGEAIARCLETLATLATPVAAVILGEGGSGGALALAMGDRLAMLSNAIYSVISPRGYASLLWKDPGREREAADTARITAFDARKMGICDQIIAEPEGGAGRDPAAVAQGIRAFLNQSLADLLALPSDRILEQRQARFRALGAYRES